jgi:hypothetical protein
MALARPLAIAGVLPAAVGALRLMLEILPRIVLAVVTTAQDALAVDPAEPDVFSVAFFVLDHDPFSIISRRAWMAQ